MRNLNRFRPARLVPLLLFAVLVAVPFLANFSGEPFYVSLVGRFLIYAIAASALNLVLGYGGMVSFGHALFLGLGVYAVGICSHYGLGNGLVHVAFALAACALAGLVTGAISLRTTGIGFIMITLAFAQMGYYLFVSLREYGGDDGMPILHASHFGGFDLAAPNVLYAVAFVTLCLLTLWSARLRSSPFGMVLRGATHNAQRVAASGLPVFRYRLVAYVISAMACGVAGVYLANLTSYASPSTLAWNVSGELIVMVALGGIGTVFGPVYGALAYLLLEELLKGYTDHWMAVLGPIIVLVAVLGRGGLAGLVERTARTPRAASSVMAVEGDSQ